MLSNVLLGNPPNPHSWNIKSLKAHLPPLFKKTFFTALILVTKQQLEKSRNSVPPSAVILKPLRGLTRSWGLRGEPHFYSGLHGGERKDFVVATEILTKALGPVVKGVTNLG